MEGHSEFFSSVDASNTSVCKFHQLQENLLELIAGNPSWITYSIKDRICLYRIDICDIPTLVVSICINSDMSVRVFKDKSQVDLSSILGHNSTLNTLSQLSNLLSLYTETGCNNVKARSGVNGFNNGISQRENLLSDFTIAMCYNLQDSLSNHVELSSTGDISEQLEMDTCVKYDDKQSNEPTLRRSNVISITKPYTFLSNQASDQICTNAEPRNTSSVSARDVTQSNSATNGNSQATSINETKSEISSQSTERSLGRSDTIPVLDDSQESDSPPFSYENMSTEDFLPHVESSLRVLVLQNSELKEEMRQVKAYMTQLLGIPNKNRTSRIPEGMSLPLATDNDIHAAEELLKSKEKFKELVNHLALLGGSSTKECVSRIMSRLVSNSLIKTSYSWIGSNSKKAFKTLLLFNVVSEAVRANPLTSDSTSSDIETRVKVWLRGATDRDGGRSARSRKVVADTTNSVDYDRNCL